MSFVRAVEITCDGPDTTSPTPCPDSAAWSDYAPARALRRRMAAAGWRITKHADRCPKCRTERPPCAHS